MNYFYDSDDNIVNWKEKTIDAFDFFTTDFLIANVLNEDPENRFNIILESLIASESDELMFICALMNAYAALIDDESKIKKLHCQITKIQKKWKMRYQQGCKQISQKLAPALAQKNKKQSKTKGISARQVTGIKPVSGLKSFYPAIKYDANGNRLEGNKLNGKWQGKSVLYYANGDRLEGIMVDSKWQGPAILYIANGDRIEGSLVDSKWQGAAVLYKSSGDVFEGNKVENNWQGPAVLYKANDDRLEGTMVDNKWQGAAVLYYASGDRLEGTMIDSKWQGPAILYITNGDRLEGSLVDSKWQGAANLYKSNGDVFEGNKVENNWQGPAILYYANDDRLEGTMVDSKWQGPAVLYYANGDRIQGNIVKNKWQGQVTKHFANGQKLKGKMVKDQFERTKKVFVFDFDQTLIVGHSGGLPKIDLEYKTNDCILLEIVKMLQALKQKNITVYINTRGIASLVQKYLTHRFKKFNIDFKDYIKAVKGAATELEIGDANLSPSDFYAVAKLISKTIDTSKYDQSSCVWAWQKLLFLDQIAAEEQVAKESVYFFDNTSINIAYAKANGFKNSFVISGEENDHDKLGFGGDTILKVYRILRDL